MTTIVDLVSAPLQGLYAIDVFDSTISFVTILGGPDKAPGTFTMVSGSIEVSGSSMFGVHVTLDASSFNAYTTGGDEYTASRQWLDAGPYPWVAHEAAALDPGATGGSADDVLTVSEIAMRVPLAIQRLEFSDGGVRVTALATVDRFAFGVTGRRGTMSRRLPVRVQLMAHRR